MTQEIKHTLTPWRIRLIDPSYIEDSRGGVLIHCLECNFKDPEDEANSRHIVKCVNESAAKDAQISDLRKALIKAHSGLHHINQSMGALPCHDLTVLMNIDSCIRFEMQCINNALAKATPVEERE